MRKYGLNNWRFKAVKEDGWKPARVPGCVHTDLLGNGQIPHPFYGTNEKDVQWIDKEDWEYETRFDVPEELLGEARLELVFNGLDTYADVRLNGRLILTTDNMFLTWTADVKDLLKPADNTLHVLFHSPVKVDLPKLEKLGYGLPAVNDQSELGGLDDKKISVFARKAPYHYGWDWGPRFVTSGIWRNVELAGWSGSRITDLYIHQSEISAEQAVLEGIVEVEAENEGEGLLTIRTGSMEWTQPVKVAEGLQTFTMDLVIPQPKLWWCRGLGEPHMYEFRAELRMGAAEAVSAAVKTGLRDIKLVQEKDEAGASFCFELNGVPVFAKGANHIPNDSFNTEVSAERYRHEIVTAALSNMNMLRVWGGGLYEEDIFYDLCDEHGILVWQDFMFACSMYPGDEAFLESVRKEAVENIKRLRNHPCIALWCGNNEIDAAWSQYIENEGWGWKKKYTPVERERIWADYEAVFHRILPNAVAGCAPGAAYWPSSPMSAWTNDEGQHSRNTSTGGDIHYWGVWHNVEPFENYNIYVGRFMSEYGFQSFPEYKSVRAYAEEHDLALESEVMLAHQKNGAGNRKIKEYMDMYMKKPKDFPSFLYMSQVLQAEAMKTAIEAHRRHKPYCMGSLYWQMNDCWPVASWAGMDYYGRWKALQYYAKRSFRDIMLSIDGTREDRLDLHAVSDLPQPVSATLHIQALNFYGECLKEASYPVDLPANSAKLAVSFKTSEWVEGHDPASIVLVASLEQDGTVWDTKEHYFTSMKGLNLPVPDIRMTEVEGSGGTAYTLTSNVLAKQVWISAEAEGIFTDNYFDLIPGKPVTVQFNARSDGPAAFVPSAPGKLEVWSMANFVE